MHRQHAVVNQYISCQLSNLTQNLTMCKTRVKLIEIILLSAHARLTDWLGHYIRLQTTNQPFPSKRHRLSCEDCLEDKSEDYHNCSVLYCVPHT